MTPEKLREKLNIMAKVNGTPFNDLNKNTKNALGSPPV